MQPRSSALALAALIAAAAAPAGAQTPAVAVTVNGEAVTFDQPPVERAGRVYVPLRGVFERLGASVVYDAGRINATKGPITVALSVGSTAATVNGQPQALDSPPFLIGARTLVPLRFVSQALGAVVAYDPGSRSVAVTLPAPPAPPPTSLPRRTLSAQPGTLLASKEPPADASVPTLRPQISATFAQPVDPNSVRVVLDSRDVTADAYVAARSFTYDPGYDLPPGIHLVAVEGATADGRRFNESWPFATKRGAATNYIEELSPPNGTRVGAPFSVRGRTRPGSRVSVVATAKSAGVADATASASFTAGPDGRFAHELSLDVGADVIDVRVQSRSPEGIAIVKTLRLLPR